MKLMNMIGETKYLVLAVCVFSYASIAAPKSMQLTQQSPQTVGTDLHVRPHALEPAEISSQSSQAAEINERITLYKRIKFEQNKKVLMHLLHDIADIQKQCKDKGYLCSVKGSDTYESLLIDLNQTANEGQSDDTLPATRVSRLAMPDLRLLGIVGGRTRFRLEDGSIKDFSLGELVADFWKVTEISAESVLLASKKQPDIKVRYQIYKETLFNDSSEENTSGAKQ